MDKNVLPITLSAVALTLGVVAVTLSIVDNNKGHKRHHGKKQEHIIVVNNPIPMQHMHKMMLKKRNFNPEQKFTKIDKDNDGVISKQEWMQHFEERQAKRAHKMKQQAA